MQIFVKIELMNLGGSIESVRLFWGGSQKCTFVDKGREGLKMLKNVCTSFMDAPKSEKLMVEIKKTKN